MEISSHGELALCGWVSRSPAMIGRGHQRLVACTQHPEGQEGHFGAEWSCELLGGFRPQFRACCVVKI